MALVDTGSVVVEATVVCVVVSVVKSDSVVVSVVDEAVSLSVAEVVVFVDSAVVCVVVSVVTSDSVVVSLSATEVVLSVFDVVSVVVVVSVLSAVISEISDVVVVSVDVAVASDRQHQSRAAHDCGNTFEYSIFQHCFTPFVWIFLSSIL